MELDTVHQSVFNILLDHKPEERLMRPEALERMRRNQPLADSSGRCSAAFFGAPPFPLVGLLSEPIKIVQASGLTMVLYEAGNLFRQL